jgi:hypothetical protein
MAKWAGPHEYRPYDLEIHAALEAWLPAMMVSVFMVAVAIGSI